MRYKTLFRILLKVLGVYFTISGVLSLINSAGQIASTMSAIRLGGGFPNNWFFYFFLFSNIAQVVIGLYRSSAASGLPTSRSRATVPTAPNAATTCPARAAPSVSSAGAVFPMKYSKRCSAPTPTRSSVAWSPPARSPRRRRPSPEPVRRSSPIYAPRARPTRPRGSRTATLRLPPHPESETPMRSSILSLYASTLDQARRIVGDVPCERFAEIPFEGAKHPAWVIAHLCLASGMVLDYLRGKDGGFGGVPEAWAEVCMPGSECDPDRAKYAGKDELMRTLDTVHAALAETYENVGDDVLATEFPVEEWRSFFPTLGHAAIYVMAHHESYHLGQLTQWRRAAGLGAMPDPAAADA